MLKLYYVDYTDDDGDGFELFVWAATPRQAAQLWREYFDDMNFRADEGPDCVYEVPLNAPPKPAALSWHREINPVDFETETLVAAIMDARATAQKEP